MSKKTRMRTCSYPGCNEKFIVKKTKRMQKYCIIHKAKNHVNMDRINTDTIEAYEIGN